MTLRYVGAGGADGNSGLSWAARKLTLNGVEDTPVVSGDTVYVGPGVYRELLTIDVSGGAASYISYVADVTGAYTDGIGGVVRITGSDNDTTATRAYCISANGKNYRKFIGFTMDMTTSYLISVVTTLCDNWVIQDCSFQNTGLANLINCVTGSTNWTIKNCIFLLCAAQYNNIYFNKSTTLDNAGHLIENCIFYQGVSAILTDRVGGIDVKNCLFTGRFNPAIKVGVALTVGQTVDVNNCIFVGNFVALAGTVAGEIVEDYNTFAGNNTDRTLTNTGANSVTYPPLLLSPILFSGIKYPWQSGELSQWSAVRGIAGTGEATDDYFGMARPATSAKNSWGAIQYLDNPIETTTVRTGSRSIKFEDAGRKQFIVPVTAVSTVFSVYCYREADYAGTNPQMVIKQPGVADTTVTDAGAASSWNELTTTLTPAASPPYVIIELVSNNTNTANPTTNDVFFDDLTVS